MDLLAPSPIIDAALSLLADGKPRTADEILSEGRSRGFFDSAMTRKHVYTSLSQYIERAVGAGRKPELTEDAQHRFRLNRAPDDWPNVDETGLRPLGAPPALTAGAIAAIKRAKKAEHGKDPTEYEQAACDLFSALGFVATHVGGLAAPDGYADAPLGPLSYRVMIECKLEAAHFIAESAAPAEAAKYKDAYHGTYCILVAPAYTGEATFLAELAKHGIAAWTTSDLIDVLQNGVTSYDLRELFSTPGIAADHTDDLLWSRAHGPAKRLRVIVSLTLSQAREQQRMDEHLGGSGDFPRFTIDAAMAAVDEELARRGASSGCTRDEMVAVFAWLTSPLVRQAVWSDAAQSSIVAV